MDSRMSSPRTGRGHDLPPKTKTLVVHFGREITPIPSKYVIARGRDICGIYADAHASRHISTFFDDLVNEEIAKRARK